MTDLDVLRLYSKHDFLTPGAAETLDLIRAAIPLAASSLVVDVAYGKGEGAFRIAERTGARVIGVDVHPFARAVAGRARSRGAGDRVTWRSAAPLPGVPGVSPRCSNPL